MKKTLIYFLLTIAVVVSGTLSYTLYNTIQTNKQKPDTQLQPQNYIQKSPSAAPLSTISFGIPPKGSSKNVVNAFWQEIQTKATNTTTIDVKDCKPEPQITKLTLAKPFTITNSGDTPKLIRILDRPYLIPQQGKQNLTADFGKGHGIFDYRCDNKNEPVGIFVVVLPE